MRTGKSLVKLKNFPGGNPVMEKLSIKGIVVILGFHHYDK